MDVNSGFQVVHFIARQTRDWKVNVIRASLDKLVYQMVFPYLGIYIISLGAQGTQLGLMNGVGMAASAALGLLCGYATNRVGTKMTYLLGVSLVATSYLILGLAQNWIIALIGVMIWWLGFGTTGLSCSVVCGGSLANEDRATGMGCCESVAQGAMGFIGPVIGASLITVFGGVGVDGIRPVFFVAVAGTVGCFLLILTQLSAGSGSASCKGVAGVGRNPFSILRKERPLWRFLAVSCLANLPTAMVLPFTQVFASEVQMANQHVLWAMVTGSAVAGMFLGIPFGRLADTIGRKKVLYALAPVFWAGNAMLIRASKPYWLVMAGILQGAFPITIVITHTMSFEFVSVEDMGEWLGVLRFFRMLSGAVLALVSGFVWDHVEPHGVFMLAIGLDALIRIPLLAGVPETLGTRTNALRVRSTELGSN